MFLKKVLRIFTSVSIRLRLSLIFVVIFGTTTILFNTFLFRSMIETLQQDFDDALFNYAVDVSQGVEIGVKGDLKFPPLRLDDGKILPFPLGTALIQVRHSSGTVLARIGNFGAFTPPFKNEFREIWQGEEAVYRTIEHIRNIPSAEADSYRMISFPLDNAVKPQLLLQVIVPMTLLETQISQRLALLQIGIPLAFLIATLGGLFLSARALKPVNRMIQTAKEIKASELSQRMPIPNAKDEIQQLALTFNEMLDRIQQAFHSQERFVADASHQLLTPLAIMRGELELLKKEENRNIDAFIKSSLQEVDSLSDIVQEMLLLSRIDAGTGALNLQGIYLDELILGILPRCERLARSKNISIKFNIKNDLEMERPQILGDNDLLEHLFINLIDNAVKYSPRDETVELHIIWKRETSQFSIEDHGPGIKDENIDYIFDRFSRGSTTETQVKGVGLGLSIAQKIATLHHTKIVVENRVPGPGAHFRIEIKNI